MDAKPGPPQERLPCEAARTMTYGFQKNPNFSDIPGIFHFSAQSVNELFGFSDNVRGLRIYMGYYGNGNGYRSHRAIAVPTMQGLNGNVCSDVIALTLDGELRTIIRELSFPCPDMCGNIADVASPLFSYDNSAPPEERVQACKADGVCAPALPIIRNFQNNPDFANRQIPGVFTFNYDDTRQLFEQDTDYGFRVYLGEDINFDDHLRYTLYAVRTRLNEALMIYEDVIFSNEVVIRKAETSARKAGPRDDYTSPLFFYEGSKENTERVSACKKSSHAR